MDAIKKKMQAMKLEKDNAMDRADACEQQAKDANLRAERVSQLIESFSVKFVHWQFCLWSFKLGLKVSKNRNDFMKTSFLPKCQGFLP